jgi:hypothetical protein
MANLDFAALVITPRELEKITGKEVSDGFVGGVLGGVCRPSSLRSLSGRLALMTIELIVAGLIFVFSLPIGLSLLRESNTGGSRVLIISTIVTIGVMIAWNIYMRIQLKSLKRLLLLLDEVDRFNQMIATLVIFEQLGQNSTHDRQSLHTALELTRENLSMALATEKLLRENHRLLDRQANLGHLDSNLITLKNLEMQQQAQDYQQIVHEALRISLAVQEEMSQI